ncbi:MAG: hypothetical protein JWM86_968 [Thermoleophilia bacterium]|nr:hypothetical protein [Thermoleophilia bacterium]
MDTDIVLVTALFAGMILFALAMLGVSLRFGPRRGTWNQPAAKLVKPGRGMFVAMYTLAIAHVLLGLVAATMVPGGGLAVFVVLVAMATFYVLCAHSWALAHAVARKRQR